MRCGSQTQPSTGKQVCEPQKITVGGIVAGGEKMEASMPEVVGDVGELAAIVRRTAQQEALNLVAESQQQGQSILAAAQVEAERIRAAALAAAERRAERECRQLHAQAHLEARRQHFLAREQLLEQVWQMAEDRLHALTSTTEYVDILQSLALAAAKKLASDTVTLAADPVGHPLLTPERLDAWSRSAGVHFVRATQALPTFGGLAATDATGRRQIDATFATRLRLVRETLREDVAALLEVL